MRRLAFAALALCVFALPARAALLRDSTAARFAAAGIDTVEIMVKRGTLTITAAADSFITLDARYAIRGADADEAAGRLAACDRRAEPGDGRIDAKYSVPRAEGCTVVVHAALPAGVVASVIILDAGLSLDRPAAPVLLDYVAGELRAVPGSGRLVFAADNFDQGFNCEFAGLGDGDSVFVTNLVDDVRFEFDPHLACRFEASWGLKGRLDLNGLLVKTDISSEQEWRGSLGTGERVTRDAPFHKMTPAQWREVIDTNLTGVFNMTHNVWPGMRERKFGRIISISSINGQKGQFAQANYAASKAGDIGFTKALAQEGARAGITVNVVCPGYINTEMMSTIPEKVMNEVILPQIPVGRLGEAGEIARAVLFLASDDAGFITGSTLSANGGQYMV